MTGMPPERPASQSMIVRHAVSASEATLWIMGFNFGVTHSLQVLDDAWGALKKVMIIYS